MRRLPSIIGAALVSAAVLVSTHAFDDTGSPFSIDTARAQTVGSGPCSLNQVAFCDTFNQPADTGNRSGQLNGTVWGVSRATGNNNFGQSLFDGWYPAQLQNCSGTTSVQPDNDIVICNGQVREVTNDGQTVTTLAMYPKQPFDFAGRTGIVTFDVSNDTEGTHAAWPEFWMSDQPVPTPFTHQASWIAAPRNGFGIRLGASAAPGGGAELAPGCPVDSNTRWTVDSAAVVRNYVADDQDNGGAVKVTPLGCVIASSGPNGGLNHVEMHVSQSQMDVYATDAGTTAPLRHIAVVQNANLTFTRGLIWLEDVHYNANKFGNQGTHTFAWDNVGFDGPILNRDLTFDVMDPLVPAGVGALDLGWLSVPGAATSKTISGVTNVSAATAALLTFNFDSNTAPTTFTYTVNGHVLTAPWPYPDTLASSWRTLALSVPLSDVVTGTNTLSIGSDQPMMVANVDLILAGAGGGGSASSQGTGGSGSTPTPTAVPTLAPATATQALATATTIPTQVSATATSVPATPTRTVPPTATRTATAVPPPTRTPTPVVLSGADFTLAGGASPATVARGSTESFSVQVTSSVVGQILVDLEIFTPAGVKVFQQDWDNQTFAAGQTRTYAASWVIPGTAATSSYLVKTGAFSAGWGKLYAWNDSLARFAVH